MSGTWYLIAAIAVMSLLTVALRALPFVMLRKFAETRVVRHIGATMPAGVMIILVAYSIKDVAFTTYPFGLPTLAGIAITVAAHHKWRNPLVSIVAGTASYMVLLNIVA